MARVRPAGFGWLKAWVLYGDGVTVRTPEDGIPGVLAQFLCPILL